MAPQLKNEAPLKNKVVGYHARVVTPKSFFGDVFIGTTTAEVKHFATGGPMNTSPKKDLGVTTRAKLQGPNKSGYSGGIAGRL